jgi:uncharacterized protein YbaP (TraB family)
MQDSVNAIGNPQPLRPLFWKLRERSVFFLGSVHFGPEGGFALPQSVMDAFDSATEIFFEIADVDTTPSPDFLFRESGSLRDDLHPNLYEKLSQHPDYGPDFDRLKLEAVGIVLGAKLYPRMGLMPQNGIDVALCHRARAQTKRVHGLETRMDQEQAILTSNHSELIAGLELQLNHPELVQQLAQGIIRSIYEGDATLLDEVRAIMHRLGPVRAHAILEKREKKWNTLLEPLFSEGRSVFFVVGALHVAESSGIISQLTHAGHTFDRVG